MRSAVVVSELAELPPGPSLAAALASLSASPITGSERVSVLVARSRQRAHEEGQYLQCLVEVGLAVPDSTSLATEIDEWASSEIAAALTLTMRSADSELRFASMIVRQLPSVHAAMLDGTLSRAKAWVFADLLEDLTPSQRLVVCARMLPHAPALTTGQLRRRLQRMIIEIDPDYASRRYRRALRERRVIGYLTEDHTVTITATGLPVGEAAAAIERLSTLAHRIQRAGHPAPLDHLKADLLLGLTNGTLHRLTEQQIIARFLADVTEVDDVEPAAAVVEPVEVPVPESAEPGTTPVKVGRRAGVEIRVGLATVLGFDERCGEIPGLGPVLAEVARELVADQRRGAQWRFAVTGPDGHPVCAGTTRRRPAGTVAWAGHCVGGIVEIQVSERLLAQLIAVPASLGPWARLVADLDVQYRRRHQVAARLDARARARFATAALAVYIEIRDRYCCFPGCRRPARKADKDHTLGRARAGPTTRANLGPLCDRHHRLKTLGRWRLAQPTPGRFRWTSRLGRQYRTRGDPIGPPF